MCRRPASSSISSCRTMWTFSPNSACCANCARSSPKPRTLRRLCRRPRNERTGLQLRLSGRTDQTDDPPRHPEGDRDSWLSGAVRQPRNADAPLHGGQVLVYQVPIPEPLRFLEPRETETRRMHALSEYGLMHVKLYEDIARFGHLATAYAYPVKVNARYVMDPSPTPKFDNPKMDNCPALQLFGAGREKRIYAIPPHTTVVSLDFEDHPFSPYRFDAPCALCAAENSYLDEIVTDDKGGRMFVCSDTDYCESRQAAGHHGSLSAAPYKERAQGESN